MQKRRILTYANINKTKIEMMFKELSDRGAAVTGQNPWDINTYYHGVILRAEWNEAASILAVSVTHSNWYISRETVCNQIDSLIHNYTGAENCMSLKGHRIRDVRRRKGEGIID